MALEQKAVPGRGSDGAGDAASSAPVPATRSGPPPLPGDRSTAEAAAAIRPAAELSGPLLPPPVATSPPEPTSLPEDEPDQRRGAKRRAAGPSRERIAANDDAPSIGGLIYALNQKPSGQPFVTAAIASGVWFGLGLGFGWVMIGPEIARSASIGSILAAPGFLTAVATLVGPILLIWTIAGLMWRVEDMKLRSAAMTEVAVRLSEPDRGAEQQIASLGQAVRRQVSFMNDAVERALGRAGELEALVHNEVSSLDRSYEENERKIRGLLQELAGERHALESTGDRISESLRAIGSEVPGLIDKLSNQQLKLAKIIEGAGQNLTALETAIATQTGSLETSIGGRTTQLQEVLEGYTAALNSVLGSRAEQLHTLLQGHVDAVGSSLDAGALAMTSTMIDRHQVLETTLTDRQQALTTTMVDGHRALETTLTDRQRALTTTMVDGHRALESTLTDRHRALSTTMVDGQRALETTLVDSQRALTTTMVDGHRAFETTLADGHRAMETTLTDRQLALEASLDERSNSMNEAIGERTQGLQIVFEEYARALDMTLANRAEALDIQLVERTRALDEAFSDRLQLFDESILRSTMAIDSAVGNSARSLTAAMESHARNLGDTIGRQAVEMDETLMSGITSVRRTSENITRQSLKAIEGLASQSELLKNVSENLLGQINTVTNRFDNQGQSIMRAANALETANYKIDSTLKNRHTDLSTTLDRLAGKADEFGRMMEGYSTTIEGSMTEAEARARRASEEMAQSLAHTVDQRSLAALAEIERLRITTTSETDRALGDMKTKFSHVTREVSEHLGNVTSQFDLTSEDMRQRAARASAELAGEQARLRQQVDNLPNATRESTEAMRRALQDQLKALDQLSSLTTREAQRRDVTPPMSQPGPNPGQQALPPPHQRDGTSRTSLPSLTSTLAQEMAQRRQPAAPPAKAATTSDPRDGWSLGDLLKRASNDEEAQQAAPSRSQPPAPVTTSAIMTPAGLDIEGMSQAIDTTTASSIWNRFRMGQRGFMIRSIYTEAGRVAFDETSQRYRGDPAFRDMVARFLVEFEGILRQTEARDPSGHAIQTQLISDIGRVYLLLAHVSGRLV